LDKCSTSPWDKNSSKQNKKERCVVAHWEIDLYGIIDQKRSRISPFSSQTATTSTVHKIVYLPTRILIILPFLSYYFATWTQILALRISRISCAKLEKSLTLMFVAIVTEKGQ
jgi:hypothetical protein